MERIFTRDMIEAALVLKQINGTEKQIVPKGLEFKYSYVGSYKNNLIIGVDKDSFFCDLAKADGEELVPFFATSPKFNSISSSYALAVNTFSFFRNRIEKLVIQTDEKTFQGFENMEFEHVAMTANNRAKRYPNLDVWLENENELLAVEVKFCDTFRGKGEVI